MSLARLTTRDYVASVQVGLIVITYLGYRTWDQMPLVQDARGMSGLGLVLGFSAFIIIRGADILDVAGFAEVVLAAVSLLLGLITLIFAQTAAAETLLAVFITSIVVVWAVELMDHMGIIPNHHLSGAAPK